MEKSIKNTDAVARKFGLGLIRATNQRLEVTREKKQKREEMIERRKTEAMAAKRHRARKKISSANKKEENYECDTGDETNPDQAGNDKLTGTLRKGGPKEDISN